MASLLRAPGEAWQAGQRCTRLRTAIETSQNRRSTTPHTPLDARFGLTKVGMDFGLDLILADVRTRRPCAASACSACPR